MSSLLNFNRREDSGFGDSSLVQQWLTLEETNSAGGDSPHNNMQPSRVVNFIIKT